jgi:hypothetical protein
MRNALFKLAAALVLMFAGAAMISPVMSADLSAGYSPRAGAASSLNCRDLMRCGPDGCNTYHVCTRPCPDGYSCAPLYGAYGPYGGVGYWGAYTDSGWGYR